MKNESTKTSHGILWRVLFLLTALLFLSVLELGKHTLAGWILTIILLAAYYILRTRKWQSTGRGLHFLFRLSLVVLFAAVLWISWPPVRRVPAVARQNAESTDIVHVAQGDLTGVFTEDGAVEVYTGIPYARPPVGELRWREPQPAEPWAGILKADHFAPMSMQTQNLPLVSSLMQIIGYHDYKISLQDNYREPASEDSLYLNIWKPAGASTGLPVLVYIHGGSLQTGQPWYADYSGEGLAREGVIVVNMGYRLGIFGFFADEELAAESENGTTGNYGLLDQICALQWVQENIAAFGGDPGNVTLAGESAGSACVSALCTSPLAKGLFRRVIGESSTVTAPQPAHSFRSMDAALQAGQETKTRLHAATVEQLRALPAEALVAELSAHHHITIDGYVLPELPCDSYQKGIHNEEAQLQGFNREESAPFILFSQASLKDYADKVSAAFPQPYADMILDLLPADSDAEARRNWADIYSAALFSYGHFCWTRQALQNQIPVYPYYFTKENGRLGSWHSGEEVYFYGNLPPSSSLYTPQDRALSETMSRYFVNFIVSGDPNGDGLPRWPAASDATEILELGDEITWRANPYLPLYEVFDARFKSE